MEKTIDPEARVVARNGLSYENLARYLRDEPEEDGCNDYIRRYLATGSAEATCAEFRKGWDASKVRGFTDRARIHAHAFDRAFSFVLARA